jgi:hypothetical protein
MPKDRRNRRGGHPRAAGNQRKLFLTDEWRIKVSEIQAFIRNPAEYVMRASMYFVYGLILLARGKRVEGEWNFIKLKQLCDLVLAARSNIGLSFHDYPSFYRWNLAPDSATSVYS